jgi:hypothetical protein
MFNLLLQFLMSSWFWSVDFFGAKHNENKSHVVGPGHCGAIMLALRAHSTDQENVFKPCTDRKCRKWWCSILHEVQFFIIVPPGNTGQHRIWYYIISLQLSYGLWNPRSRVRSRPKPLDFSGVVKILKHAFLRRESKICVPCPSFATCKRT